MFASVFYTAAATCIVSRSLVSARHATPAAVRAILYAKGRGRGPHNEIATFRFHDAVVIFVEGAYVISPLQIQDILESFSSRRCPTSSPGIHLL